MKKFIWPILTILAGLFVAMFNQFIGGAVALLGIIYLIGTIKGA